jgi:hypothetical protein
MRETRPQQTLRDDEATLVVGGEETTLVAPRFDDDETQVARPVVPLDADAPVPPEQAPTASGAAHDYRRPHAPRRTLTLALVLVSVLVGGVLGGAGLYLYQRQSQSPAVSPAAATTQTVPPADAAQAPAAEGQNTTPPEAPTQPTETPASAPNVEEAAAPPTPAEEAPAAAREPEPVPASEGTPRRGKKGERDEEIQRRTTPRPDGNVARADQPEARQVDTILYRQRRAERRAERRAARRARRGEDDVDRLRRIFEGSPQ